MGNIFLLYFQWHYADRPKNIWIGWSNCLKFNLNFWSVPVLLRTLFSHWRRYRYSYGKGFDFKRYIEAFSFNIISRVIGFIMRSVLIAFGLITEVLVFAAGLAVLIIWMILPALLILGFYYGFKILL